jgi:hypothetical protein
VKWQKARSERACNDAGYSRRNMLHRDSLQEVKGERLADTPACALTSPGEATLPKFGIPSVEKQDRRCRAVIYTTVSRLNALLRRAGRNKSGPEMQSCNHHQKNSPAYASASHRNC